MKSAPAVGAHELWGRDHQRPKRGQVTVAFGPPIDFSDQLVGDEQADQLAITRILRDSVAKLVHQHGGPPPHPVAD